MEHLCKLCRQLAPSIKKEEKKEVISEEMKIHVETHRTHLQLINGSTISLDELFIRCFSKMSEVNKGGCNNKFRKVKSKNPITRQLLAVCDKNLFAKSESGRWKRSAHCHECGANIKAVKDRGLGLINHASVHLGKPLFGCRHCNYRCVCKPTLYNHLKTKHQLRLGDKANYIDLTADYLDEMVSTVRRCFGRPVEPRQLCLTKSKTKMVNTPFNQVGRSFSILCHKLFAESKAKRDPKQTKARCLECNLDQKIFVNHTGELQLPRVIDHALVHLGKLLFECRHCDYKSVCKATLRKHLKRNHDLSTVDKANYKDLTTDYEEEVTDFIKRCFGPRRVSSKVCIDQSDGRLIRNKKQPFSRFCIDLFAGRDRKLPVACFECGSKLRLFGLKGDVRTPIVVGHALSHLKKFLFACRHCDNCYTSKITMVAHLSRMHNVNGAPANYIDSSNSHEQEIKDMLTRCYDVRRDRTHQPVLDSSSRPTSKRQYCSPLVKFCSQLFENHKGEGGLTVECLKCGQRLVCVSKDGASSSRSVINHANHHLKRQMFNCRHCKFRSTTRSKVKAHLKHTHSLSGKINLNYEDLSGKHLDEIKAMILQCFRQFSLACRTERKLD